MDTNKPTKFIFSLFFILTLATSVIAAKSLHAMYMNPFSQILLTLFLIIIVTLLGRYFAGFFHQTAGISDLIKGIILGNILYWCGSALVILIMHLSETGKLLQLVWNQHIAILLMVIITTLITPTGLQWSFAKLNKGNHHA